MLIVASQASQGDAHCSRCATLRTRPRRNIAAAQTASSLIYVASASSAHNLSSLLLRSAKRFPALPALAAGSTVLCSYAELAARVTRLAFALRAAGLAPGDRVLLAA